VGKRKRTERNTQGVFQLSAFRKKHQLNNSVFETDVFIEKLQVEKSLNDVDSENVKLLFRGF
jgi:hypothetical protein